MFASASKVSQKHHPTSGTRELIGKDGISFGELRQSLLLMTKARRELPMIMHRNF